MKSFILCFLLISLVVLNSEVQARRNGIDPGVVDPCKRPGGPHPGCNGNTQPVRPYDRDCSTILRCRDAAIDEVIKYGAVKIGAAEDEVSTEQNDECEVAMEGTMAVGKPKVIQATK
ncbi:hypothetical protein DVH24_028542 [Malus domestica]|uniref:Rapid ALkalinization Factor n=1 Tax=Malus domestica TaxID=3750 RepID=A0A498IZ81_MALDO|nr:hypothetical protein DVH24_028542 [Malus domestica]